MKFEKINDNILRIVLSFDELPDCNSLADLMSNTELAKSSFLHILDKAGSMVGFGSSFLPNNSLILSGFVCLFR